MSDQSESVGDFRMPEMIAAETGKVLPEQEAYLYLIRAAQILSGPVADLFAANGISGKQYNALRAVRRRGNEGATVNEVRQQMTDPRADVTRLVDRLERDGYVVRKGDKSDRRLVRVVLSSTGKSLLKKIDGPLLEVHRFQFGRFQQGELELLKTLLKQIVSVGND
ncbi:MarR family winged helix-turn-helix transcriptional regulator [Agrobacterium fabrum]|uniref:MarR family winged helix-turn-helix transcriptional regulator n=1 Tax=Agrobacterium fabrum TaxID=1176649 RepID=UPI0021582A37|nr:MarR family transcriptional regulator [Agrobacterium fabrum]MCR6727726.1 MarR family transcriptional regulator [Agrobacterium fabrum]